MHLRWWTALACHRCNTNGVNGKQGGIYGSYPCTEVTIRPNPGSCNDDDAVSSGTSESHIGSSLKTFTKVATDEEHERAKAEVLASEQSTSRKRSEKLDVNAKATAGGVGTLENRNDDQLYCYDDTQNGRQCYWCNFVEAWSAVDKFCRKYDGATLTLVGLPNKEPLPFGFAEN